MLGTNQAFHAGGNLFAALALGAIGFYFSLRQMLLLEALLGVGAISSILRSKAEKIDYNAAAGSSRRPLRQASCYANTAPTGSGS